MHDIDRTQIGNNALETYEYSGGGASGRVFNEQQEYELASELLEVNSEQEFEQFLGDLISKAGKAIGGFISSPTGKALGGVLKSAAGQLLPMAGQALGGMIGGPAGSQIGGQLAQAAGSAFGLELEQEDREFETAATFVRLAGDAVKNAVQAPPGANPRAVAQNAVAQAAQIHAPGLLGSGPGGNGGPGPGSGMNGDAGPSNAGGGRSGRWVRRGAKIILFGV